MIYFLAWYALGVGGAYLIWLSVTNFEARLHSTTKQTCPTPLAVCVWILSGFAGGAMFCAAVLISLGEDGVWHKPGRFKWWTTPLCSPIKTRPKS